MTREIVTRWKDGDDADGEVEVTKDKLWLSDEIGGHISLDWDQWDRLVAEVAKLRPLVNEEAA